MHLTFVALFSWMVSWVKIFMSLSKKKILGLLFSTLFIKPSCLAYVPGQCGDPRYQDRKNETKQNKTKHTKTSIQDTLSGMFTANYSLGIYCPASFLDKFSISEFLHCLHLDFVFSLSTFHSFWGCGSNITLEYLLSKQYEEKRKLSPTRKLDNGIRCLCLFH